MVLTVGAGHYGYPMCVNAVPARPEIVGILPPLSLSLNHENAEGPVACSGHRIAFSVELRDDCLDVPDVRVAVLSQSLLLFSMRLTPVVPL